MPVLHPIARLKSIRSQQKIGYRVGYGGSEYGVTALGVPVDFAGIYRVRHYNQKVYHEKMDFYTYVITHTDPQNVNRGKFANAVSAWQALTTEQKAVYNKRAVGRHMFGYHLFLREFMLL
jgi:hypothetical protein